jgi:hypothetical protein
MKTPAEKYQMILANNTFWYSDPTFEENFETRHIEVIKTILLNLRETAKSSSSQNLRSQVDQVLAKSNGLLAILTLNGLSIESLKRIITLARIVDDPELNQLLKRNEWVIQETDKQFAEWGSKTIEQVCIKDESFRQGLVSLFFEGASNTLLSRVFPVFELRKLSIQKLTFEIEPILDTLIRYKIKGSRSSQGENNPEAKIANVLDKLGLSYVQGRDVDSFLQTEQIMKRTIDFMIPDAENPVMMIESSFLVTTSSGMGDKAKTENSMGKLIKNQFPNSKFVGFIDGIGWYVRRRDLQRMVEAFDEVFTFHDDEMTRFEQYLREVLG